ncbi:MAG: LD-carboxypeptidase [Bacteroidetes bacterium]|jgi:muramoyltetrapeptide carboxypeptidase|nr:LD-carboxypeptidase [Bacteroidota bacterium]MBT5530013.1 LD-carboxypeptidase [Cytophagia bacterium]MBT3421426.1 LD-carboxypeptidase [Bacteroidota bacterium]MBT3802205.1 LD-carboxypeptidase [Bacteroidota bacterium]MBT3933248.1 LD-carboxypeptidase [Bacteroidota bacterium]
MIIPAYLKAGDKVGIVSPAGKVPKEQVLKAIKTLESWGLEVLLGKHVFGQHFQYASYDENRLSDFQYMLDDNGIKAILCSRGGYGSIRIIDQLDFAKLNQHPKWLIGFSDISLLHAHINHNMHICSIHGPMTHTLAAYPDDESSLNLKKALFGEHLSYVVPFNLYNRRGEAGGQLIGGNLAILTSLLGSNADFNPKGKILFIEEIGEYVYRIDRMMWSLKRAGKLKGLAGLIVGQFTDIKDNNNPFGQSVHEIISEHVKDYNFPVCFGFPAGHEDINQPILLGKEYRLSVNNMRTRLE